MCGIAGYINRSGPKDPAWLEQTAAAMADSVAHRGPDDAGIWADQDNGIAFGHRRLSIIDLSQEGHQPKASASGRFVICYNGEIYNFRDLRGALEKEGVAFRGGSDTEVLLEAVERWGLEKTLKKTNGMFAFALWDAQERTLSLARDRLGKKPLYYGWSDDGFAFASELKAFRALETFKPAVNRQAAALFMRYNYVPAPFCIYEDVFKLPAASYLTMPLDWWRSRHDLDAVEGHVKSYWPLEQIMAQAQDHPFADEDEALSFFDELLTDATALRMVADVPLGAFLSGGIDSSLIAALMQKQATRPVKTYSIGFHEASYNEAVHAKDVAAHLGTDHTEFYVTGQDALDVVPQLPDLYDEPFADSSQIPTYLLCRLARQHVTVALSGDGGDETFYGYNRYLIGYKTHRAVSKVPRPLRSLMAGMLNSSPLVAQRKYNVLARVLDAANDRAFYRAIVSCWDAPEAMVRGEIAGGPDSFCSAVPLGGFDTLMQYADIKGYLADDILVKVDRASMAAGLEARAPLLDYRIAENMWRLPYSMKYGNGRGKVILRRLLTRYLPADMFARPKQGFSIPVAEWLRGPLNEWAEDLLSDEAIKQAGLLDSAAIRKEWQAFLRGRDRNIYGLWGALMLQAWQRRWG